MKSEDLVLIIGAGIAGLSAARMLRDAGLKIKVIAREIGEASRVPDALLNPVRGKRGSIAADAGLALEALWKFYPNFTEIKRGILRPIPLELRENWSKKLEGSGINHSWSDRGLFLEDAGWLRTSKLLDRLKSGLDVEIAEVAKIDNQTAFLRSGQSITAKTIVTAGGASGAHLAGLGGRFTPGSVLRLTDEFPEAMSWGVYVAGESLGGSYLPHATEYAPHQILEWEKEWLLQEGRRLVGRELSAYCSWSGVRYRTDGEYLKHQPYGYSFTGFGSAAYFYAPLYAQRLLEKIQGAK